MNREYHYLVASLPELVGVDETRKHPIPGFLDFCAEELTPSDMDGLSRCFIFNDIRNVCGEVRERERYRIPSYYSFEVFEECLADNDLFHPFIADYLHDTADESAGPAAAKGEDELLRRLFEDIGAFAGGFVRDYLMFELHSRNIGTALSHRAVGMEYADRIITADYISERIARSPAPDFGLGGDISAFQPVLDLFGKAEPMEIEKTMERIRWEWLDGAVGYSPFTAEAVYAYAIKLQSVERWLLLDREEGKRMLDSLVESARRRARTMITKIEEKSEV